MGGRQDFDGDYRVVGERVREPWINWQAVKALVRLAAINLFYGGIAWLFIRAIHHVIYAIFPALDPPQN